MWTYLFSFLLFRRLKLSKPFRYVLAVLLIGLFIVVLIYTLGLFLMLEERIRASHATDTRLLLKLRLRPPNLCSLTTSATRSMRRIMPSGKPIGSSSPVARSCCSLRSA